MLVSPGLRLWKPPPLYTEQLHPKKREAGNFRVWLKRIQEYEWLPLTTLRIHLLGLGVPPSLQQCYKSMGIFCTVFWALGRERRELLCRDKGPPLCCAVSGKLYHPFVSWGLKNRIMAISGDSQLALVVKNLPANAGDAGDPDLIPGWGRFPWRRAWQPTPVFLPGEPHGQRSLVGYSPWGCR